MATRPEDRFALDESGVANVEVSLVTGMTSWVCPDELVRHVASRTPIETFCAENDEVPDGKQHSSNEVLGIHSPIQNRAAI